MAKSWLFQFLGLAVILLVAALPFGRGNTEEKVLRARSRAEVLAYQVAQLYRESLTTSEASVPDQRAPASAIPAESTPAEGLMGQDPWGRAYSYRIVPTDGQLRVEMTSPGPDASPDSSSDDILLVLTL